jgi:hypothetical protein
MQGTGALHLFIYVWQEKIIILLLLFYVLYKINVDYQEQEMAACPLDCH